MIESQAKDRSTDPDFRQRAYLVSRGLPFDVAFKIEASEALAWVVVFGEMDGHKFDWNTLSWDLNPQAKNVPLEVPVEEKKEEIVSGLPSAFDVFRG